MAKSETIRHGKPNWTVSAEKPPTGLMPGMVEITIRIKLMLEVLYQTIYKDIPPLTAALEKIVPTEAEK
tara:strand:- start:37 stop:243 length:207 start_codon:yes stop_codon:yes gene_type:complete